MRVIDLIATVVPSAMDTRVCSRSDCFYHGQPQPAINFYKKKSACKDCCGRMSNSAHDRRRELLRNSPYAVDHEPGGYLPIGPWRQWLVQQIDANGGYHGGGVKVIAWELGITERSIGRWLNESKHVMLDVADRALCNRGTPWVLRELYPSLFDFPDLDEVA